MNAHQLDETGTIINTIVVDSLDFLPNLVSADIGGSIGDKVLAGTVVHKIDILPPEPVQGEYRATI